ncbi:MAG: isoprenyl transferase [Bacteroidia bacterium]|nr:isoprenyl transferase [Bacteroidia bacterium]
MSAIFAIDKTNIPAHIAVIMDGNGRWAKQRGKFRIFGHSNAINAVRDTIEIAAELGVKYLTLYAFSTENWNRPQDEVGSLMSLLVSSLQKEMKGLHKNNIRLLTIGDMDALPSKVQKQLQESMELTANNTHMTLVLALSYSARWEITTAIQQIATDVKEGKLEIKNINDALINSYLNTGKIGIPDPDLFIRTSGEHRISNFLLWQLSYSELYFTNVLWPDFNKGEFINAILDYQNRERRFGQTSEQLIK